MLKTLHAWLRIRTIWYLSSLPCRKRDHCYSHRRSNPSDRNSEPNSPSSSLRIPRPSPFDSCCWPCHCHCHSHFAARRHRREPVSGFSCNLSSMFGARLVRLDLLPGKSWARRNQRDKRKRVKQQVVEQEEETIRDTRFGKQEAASIEPRKSS